MDLTNLFSPPKTPLLNSTLMHDFCITIPYGLLLFIGGAIGFLHKGSLVSLFAGSGLGIALMGLGKVSWDNYLSVNADVEEDKRPIDFPTVTSLAISLTITVVLSIGMTLRFAETEKFMPSGLIAVSASLMSIFYIYKIITQKEHVRSHPKSS